jgi:tetratricopeptide (TPR) repeat protein
MLTPKFRLILIAASAALAIGQMANGQFMLGLLLLLSGGMLAYGYFKTGTVYIAYRKMVKGNYTKAEQLLGLIKNPKRLARGQRAYYHFVSAALAMAHQNYTSSREHFTQAIQTGLRTDNDNAIAYLNLAFGEMKLGNKAQAYAYFNEAEKLEYRAELQDRVDELKEQLDKM